jgi:uncharacterized YigZ family protein
LKKDTYHTIESPTYGLYKEKGSKFEAYAYPVETEKEISEALQEVRKLHPKARHHCYAYRLGLDKTQFRANDDGEPSGTAGRPILGQLDSYGVTNTLVVVVRYFGGTLLGASGLIRSYRSAAADALEQASILEKQVKDYYRIAFTYQLMSPLMNAIKKLELDMVEQNFTESPSLDLAIPQSEVQEKILHLKAQVGNRHLEEVDEQTEIPDLNIDYLHTR